MRANELQVAPFFRVGRADAKQTATELRARDVTTRERERARRAPLSRDGPISGASRELGRGAALPRSGPRWQSPRHKSQSAARAFTSREMTGRRARLRFRPPFSGRGPPENCLRGPHRPPPLCAGTFMYARPASRSSCARSRVRVRARLRNCGGVVGGSGEVFGSDGARVRTGGTCGEMGGWFKDSWVVRAY